MERILDVTCGDRSIWFDKKESHTIYCDKREIDVLNEIGNNIKAERGIHIHPDIIADFTDLPFKDETFNLVVADPPHLKDASETAWLTKKYGSLHDGWEEMLHDGFREWMRVLKYGGGAHIQMVRDPYTCGGSMEGNRAKAFIRSSFREEDEYILGMLYEV